MNEVGSQDCSETTFDLRNQVPFHDCSYIGQTKCDLKSRLDEQKEQSKVNIQTFPPFVSTLSLWTTYIIFWSETKILILETQLQEMSV